MNQASSFFVAGGTLNLKDISYARRPADDDLLNRALSGEYCNVLAARQTGKSSLVVRTDEQLKQHGVKTVRIDLTTIGSLVSASEWYFGLISILIRELVLQIDGQAWWNTEKEKSPVQRFSDFLQEIVLCEVSNPIVIFIDEIDTTLNLPFTDDFFAAIRSLYNARSQNADLKRLTFVLIGVARPAELIKNRTRTPYNIGTAIDITDFNVDELGSFESVLEKAHPGQGKQILEWVLGWTGGQPYLTQKLCAEIVKKNNDTLSAEDTDQLVERLFLGDMARTDLNLKNIRNRVMGSRYLVKILRIYKRVLTNKPVKADEQSIEQNELKLTGLVKTTPSGTLKVRNRIYAKCFDENWVKESMPSDTSRRIAIISSVIAVIAIAAALYFYNQTDEIKAQNYIENFCKYEDVKIKFDSLVGLIRLGGEEYPSIARKLFFNELSSINNLPEACKLTNLSVEKQLALFDPTIQTDVGDLVLVVDGLYQYADNTPEGNALLSAMANSLQQSTSSDASLLKQEIDYWLAGREAAQNPNSPRNPIDLFNSSYLKSSQRERWNPAVLYDEAVVYSNSKNYFSSLVTYNKALALYVERKDTNGIAKIQAAILGDQELADYYRENPVIDNYNLLSEYVAVPTTLPPTPIPTFTVTPFPTEITDFRGVEMVLVPAGEFTMGSDADIALKECFSFGYSCKDENFENEEPQQMVYLDPYYIDKYEVTYDSYLNCVKDKRCAQPSVIRYHYGFTYYDNSQSGNYPLNFVDWENAALYCEWRRANLPTESQWEKAARGTDGRQYPWDDTFDCAMANAGGSCYGKEAFPGGSFPGVSPFGAYDMAGNVWEWTEEGILRGGSWNSKEYQLRAPYRLIDFSLGDMPSEIGFRCVRTPTNDPRVTMTSTPLR